MQRVSDRIIIPVVRLIVGQHVVTVLSVCPTEWSSDEV